MNKITQLWIRACKSHNPAKRCESILRRFYMGGVMSEADIKTGVIIHLSGVVDGHCPMKTIDLISQMEESQRIIMIQEIIELRLGTH